MEVPLALPWLASAAALCSDLCPIPGGEQRELGRRGRGRAKTKGEDIRLRLWQRLNLEDVDNISEESNKVTPRCICTFCWIVIVSNLGSSLYSGSKVKVH